MTHMMSRSAGTSTSDWLNWIANDDDNQTIDGDADGVFTQDNKLLVDISQALSIRLGRQLSMMSTYKVNYIRIEMFNFDDANDNDSGLQLNGKIHHWGPSKHRIDALQLGRFIEKQVETNNIDTDSYLLSTEKDYVGFRFNWDADDQVAHSTVEGFANLAGSEWDMEELFNVYNQMVGPATEANALWSEGRTGYPNNLGFACSYVNDVAQDETGLNLAHNPVSRPYEILFPRGQELEVLGGLLMIDFTHCSSDSPINIIDDDYGIRVTIGVSGWSDF